MCRLRGLWENLHLPSSCHGNNCPLNHQRWSQRQQIYPGHFQGQLGRRSRHQLTQHRIKNNLPHQLNPSSAANASLAGERCQGSCSRNSAKNRLRSLSARSDDGLLCSAPVLGLNVSFLARCGTPVLSENFNMAATES